jgi:hypothetical protein
VCHRWQDHRSVPWQVYLQDRPVTVLQGLQQVDHADHRRVLQPQHVDAEQVLEVVQGELRVLLAVAEHRHQTPDVDDGTGPGRENLLQESPGARCRHPAVQLRRPHGSSSSSAVSAAARLSGVKGHPGTSRSTGSTSWSPRSTGEPG